jgi:hypothetical protein
MLSWLGAPTTRPACKERRFHPVRLSETGLPAPEAKANKL